MSKKQYRKFHPHCALLTRNKNTIRLLLYMFDLYFYLFAAIAELGLFFILVELLYPPVLILFNAALLP